MEKLYQVWSNLTFFESVWLKKLLILFLYNRYELYASIDLNYRSDGLIELVCVVVKNDVVNLGFEFILKEVDFVWYINAPE